MLSAFLSAQAARMTLPDENQPTARMHEHEVSTDVNLVRRLLAAQFPDWSGLPLTPVRSAGTDNAIYRLGSGHVVRLPRVDLPEILLEIAARTDFTAAFTHVSERAARVTDLGISICAVLLAEACNIGFEPLVRHDAQKTDAMQTNKNRPPFSGRYSSRQVLRSWLAITRMLWLSLKNV